MTQNLSGDIGYNDAGDFEFPVSTGQAEVAAAREDMIARGKKLYDERLEDGLGAGHTGRYVAVEPEFVRQETPRT